MSGLPSYKNTQAICKSYQVRLLVYSRSFYVFNLDLLFSCAIAPFWILYLSQLQDTLALLLSVYVGLFLIFINWLDW